MSVPVYNNFGILLAEKRKREKRNIPIMEVSKKTGIARRTLYAWQSNRVDRFDSEIITALCRYFGVGISDLLELVHSDTSEPKAKAAK